ncbi:MAG TPA: lytic murein transglycosylase [Burkholderiaceae bacterium]|nr:lytic murein transglycosylase [Burkholderiaceae bacterium]
MAFFNLDFKHPRARLTPANRVSSPYSRTLTCIGWLLGTCLPAASLANPAPDVNPTSWAHCLARLQPQALQAGVTRNTWQSMLEGIEPDATVLEKLDNQPEFRTPIWDYLAGLVDDERIAEGQRLLAEHAATLERVQAAYGVTPATVVAVWGVESNFGQSFGRYPLVQALGTLSCYGRRQAFFQKELYATLRIAQGGHVAPSALVGSWAGAFGQTQFMPTTYERLAIDFDGDGKRDLTTSIPDALASTAHFLQKAGWRTGMPWGMEVKLPTGFSTDNEGRRTKRPASVWSERGVRTLDGRDPVQVWGADTPLGLMVPGQRAVGAQPELGTGPAFLVSRNFDALFSYNAAESYGLAIAHLSDRLLGKPPFAAPWPTDDAGLSRAQRRELQTLLTLRGHDIGSIDGMLGERSRAAIRVEQTRLGHTSTGRGGQKLLKALQSP